MKKTYAAPQTDFWDIRIESSFCTSGAETQGFTNKDIDGDWDIY